MITRKTENISPDKAREYLGSSPRNRSISQATVQAYARDMVRGAWRKEVGEGIHFHHDGHLVNGHHRLRAVIQSGVTTQFMVVRGVSDEDVLALDRGRARTVGDQLFFAGEKNANFVAASVRMLFLLANRRLGNAFITPSEAKEILELHPRIRDSVGVVGKPPTMIAGSHLAPVHYIGAYVQGRLEQADEFIGIWKSGVPSGEGCPVHVLRERFVVDKAAKARLHPDRRICALIHVWNLFSSGQRIKRVQIPDQLPPIQGWDKAALWVDSSLREEATRSEQEPVEPRQRRRRRERGELLLPLV